MRGKPYVLRPVQLVLLTPLLVSPVTGFGLAKAIQWRGNRKMSQLLR